MSQSYLSFAALALVACATSGSGAGDAPLGGRDWRLVELAGAPAKTLGNDRDPYLRFEADSNRVFGSGGCNRIAGKYTRDGASLRFSEMIGTKMACIDEDMNRQEVAMLDALQRADSHTVTGDTLVLSGGGAALARLVARSPAP